MCAFRWEGVITSVQPRIRLSRSFDQRSHTYLGYALRIKGRMQDIEDEFWIGVGKAMHAKTQFVVGMQVSGECHPVENPRLETVDYYRAAKMSVHKQRPLRRTPPPYLAVPPDLPTYRQRGHRRLAAVTYKSKCSDCMWGCHMAVEMIIDQWNPNNRRYRTETFCYGPKNCLSYKPGPTRKVPGRRGMSYTEENWVDEEAVMHRTEDE